MDSNGYNKSLFDTRDGVCWYCHKATDTARHEIFEGVRNRKLSKLTGLWVCLCPMHHYWAHHDVHIRLNPPLTMKQYLQDKAEQLFKNTYAADFNHVFYGPLKNWEIEDLKDEVKEHERKHR